MSRPARSLALLFLISAPLAAQLVRTYSLDTVVVGSLPSSNVINDLAAGTDTIWFATEKGLDRFDAQFSRWAHYANTNGFGGDGISAIAIRGSTIWASTAYTTEQEGQSMPAGSGLHFSPDGGITWTAIPQPRDSGFVDTLTYGINKIPALDITTQVNNITYDIALTQGTVWIASFAGMLRSSTDNGTSWNRIVLPPDFGADRIGPSDTLQFDLAPTSGSSGLTGNLNHRVFSVFAGDDSTVWVGTAGGINLSTDGGVSWQKFDHTNEASPISGNFVVAINEQTWGATRTVWAATVNAESADETRGVSFSSDRGTTWKTTLLGEFAHNFAFMDSLVYVVTDDGIFRTSDRGASWTRNGTIYDPANLFRFAASALYGVATTGDTVWVVGPEGAAFTIDSPSNPFGSSWKIFRTYSPASSSPGKTYSFPTPFSPVTGVVRIHYAVDAFAAPAAVTIRIFDFGMLPVKTLIRNAPRSSSAEFDEIWDGRDDLGRGVANGVYFYHIQVSGTGQDEWGKIFVLR